MKSTKPRDTSKDLPGFAALFLVGSGYIEAQEKQGQLEAVASTSLPSDIRDRASWEALGFTFGEPFADDPLFVPATMPPGWKKAPTNHDMHVAIHDAAGNERGSFFYKAAFYDRKAHMGSPRRRYQIQMDCDRLDEIRKNTGGDAYDVEALAVVDSVTKEPTFRVEGDVPGSDWNEREAARQAVRAKAVEWLTEHYPDHANPAAYWPTEKP